MSTRRYERSRLTLLEDRDSCDSSKQRWRTFLRNQAAGVASVDLFVARTISFKLLYGLVILRHARRRLVRIRIAVSSNPTAQWITGQVTEAYPWDEAPRHLIRDRDGAFGSAYSWRVHAMGIRDHPTAARSPWENGHVERIIGSVRRECLDHVLVLDETHFASCPQNLSLNGIKKSPPIIRNFCGA